MTERVDTAIVGAGPYGLAVAAHLREAGRDPYVFGEPFLFWRTQTPIGMILRSPHLASDVGDPHSKLTLQDYERDSGRPLPIPVPVDRFLEYGQWFQERAVPEFDPREVCRIEVARSGFRLEVAGDTFEAKRVVVAAGIGAFQRRPVEFDGLESDIVSHAADQHDLSVFSGRRVTVVGGGQSALESAALLHEAGADVDVIVRAESVKFLSAGKKRQTLPIVNRILYANAHVGPPILQQLNERAAAFRYLPRGLVERIDRRSIRPAGAAGLPQRLESVAVRCGVEIADASRAGSGVRLRFKDGTEQTVDHVLLGTGYRVDLPKFDFWSPALRDTIECHDGYPKLSKSFETTVPGLHVVGAPAARTFGPLMRFVAGSGFAARSVARGLAR